MSPVPRAFRCSGPFSEPPLAADLYGKLFVTVDGIEPPRVIAANADEGWVAHHKLGDDGYPILDDVRAGTSKYPAHLITRGEVQIGLKSVEVQS